MEALRLSVALALIGAPGLLGVDDTDLKLSDTERAEVWALLRSIAEAGTTVVAVCSEAPEGAVAVSTTDQDEAGSEDEAAPEDEANPETDAKEVPADALAEAGRA